MSIIEDVILKTKNAVQYVRTDKLKLHPNNPRFIKDRDFDILCESIQANPEFFEARPILCTPDMVVFAGNMRLRAARHLKQKTVPVIIMDITEEKARELMIRDNVQSGQWDTEALAGMFEIQELQAWGMPEFVFGGGADGGESSDDENLSEVSADSFTQDFQLADGDRAPFQQITFTLSDTQAAFIKNAISEIKQTDDFKFVETHGNENSNGNALYLIVVSWAGQRI